MWPEGEQIPGIDQLTDEDCVIVTGGTGLLGCAVRDVVKKHKLRGKWVFLGSKDGDLRDLGQCKKLFELHKPTYVLHLAAFVGGLFRNMKMKVRFWHDNVNMNNNVMACANDAKVKKAVTCLSTCIFPDDIKYPLDEKSLHLGPPHDSNNAYAYAKRMLDMLGRWYNEQEGYNRFVSVIPTNLFGPNDNYCVEVGHVLPGLMHKCLIAKKTGGDFVVFGTGKPLRQFCYSLDCAELLLWTLLNYNQNEPVILSVSEEEEISIGDAARSIVDALQFKGNVVFDTSRADGQYKKTASNAKLMSLYPNYKFTPFKDAVQQSVDWFVSNFETARK